MRLSDPTQHAKLRPSKTARISLVRTLQAASVALLLLVTCFSPAGFMTGAAAQANAQISAGPPAGGAASHLAQGDLTKGGCDLAFLGSENQPTLDGQVNSSEWEDASTLESGGCLGPLADGGSYSTLSSTLPGHAIKVYTKRLQNDLYLAFDIDDASNPGDPNATVGETIQVLLDPQHAGGATVPTTAFRLDFTTTRGAQGDATSWYQGTGNNAAPWNGPLALPAGIQVARQNRASNAGYGVEMKIPQAAIGHANNFADMGMAIAFFNALSFQYPLNSGNWAVTAAHFPDTTTLQISNAITAPSPDATDLPAWKQPQNWGTAYLRGAGDAFYFDSNPVWWLSNDIKVAFCNAANFADAGSPATSNPKWYKYYPATPCDLRLWIKFHRTGGQGEVGRRILALWAESGANPQKWHFIGLTAPVKATPGPSEAIIDPMLWDHTNIPANQPAHPCIRAFILPPDLNRPGFDEAYFQAIGSEGAGVNNNQKIADFMSAYGLTNAQAVQMNIELISTGSPQCPNNCVTIGYAPGIALVSNSRPQVFQKSSDVTVALEAFGVVENAKAKKFVVLEAMGGVGKVLSADYIAKNAQDIHLRFNISNSADYPRRMFVNTAIYPPEAANTLKLTIDQPGKVLSPGETQPQDVHTGGSGIPTPPFGIPYWLWLLILLLIAVLTYIIRKLRGSPTPHP